MKNILVVADIHQRESFLRNLDKFFSKNNIQAILVLGDLTDRNDKAISFAKDFYRLIKKHNLRLLYIHGNNEPEDVVNFFNKSGCSIHNNLQLFGGVKFIGIGGWGDEIQLDTLKNIKGSFFATHVPPLKSSLSKNMENTPVIHAFGHSHKSEYFKKEGSVFYLSLKSAGYYSRGAIVRLPKVKVEFVDI